MKWNSHITFEAFKDAWTTWNTHFKENTNPKIELNDFFHNHGTYHVMTLSEIIDGDIENIPFDRINTPQHPINVYPDNNENFRELQSIMWYLRTNDSISPLVVIQLTDQMGHHRKILLDGIHRLIAASIDRKQKILVYFMTF